MKDTMAESKRKKILVIEDNEMFQKILKKRIEARGYDAVIASDGLEGWGLTKTVQPDLILLDLLLPKMDGHKVCRLVKHDYRLRDIPVAIFTSRDGEEDADLAKQVGADAFIVKTTRSEIMMSVIDKLLKTE